MMSNHATASSVMSAETLFPILRRRRSATDMAPDYLLHRFALFVRGYLSRHLSGPRGSEAERAPRGLISLRQVKSAHLLIIISLDDDI